MTNPTWQKPELIEISKEAYEIMVEDDLLKRANLLYLYSVKCLMEIQQIQSYNIHP